MEVNIPRPTFFNLKPAKRAALIRAARSEFARSGYAKTNLDRVCRKARIPKGSLYQYFDDKEDLFVFISKDVLQKAWVLFQEAMEKSPLKDCFEMFSRALLFAVDLGTREPEMASLYIRIGFLQETPLRERILGDIHEKNRAFLERFFSWGQEDGLIDPNLDKEAAGFLLDAVSNRFQELMFFRGSGGSAGPPINRTVLKDFINRIETFLRKSFAKKNNHKGEFL